MSAKSFEEWAESSGFVDGTWTYSDLCLAWTASRAALLADRPDVAGLVRELYEQCEHHLDSRARAASAIESLSARVSEQSALITSQGIRLMEAEDAEAELAKFKAHATELIRRIGGIADWRGEAHKYDADVGNEPRTFCEDVELIEQAAQDAIDHYRAAYPKDAP